ncbi:MAG: bile acid:sodium symporter family protein [Moraxellaceae bacterium]|nr:bile acid:sodium symporter family protein [Moraxellaceae bacterium]MDP1776173.1 bile acid:sodium symporter family protein [Moraxellaceae bacterium]
MEQTPLIAIGLPIALFIIMIGMGLTLTPAEFQHEAKRPRSLILGSVLQIVGMPILGFGLVYLLDVPAALAVGLIIIAACPGGTTSNLVAFMARGNVALSIMLTVICSLATIITLPISVNIALDLFVGEANPVRMPVVKTVAMLMVLILVPVTIGMLFRRWKPELAIKADKLVGAFGAVVLLALIIGICISNADQLGSLLASSGPACLALNVGGIILGMLGGRIFRISDRDAITISVELGIKNGTLGMLIAMTMLSNTEMAVPSAVYGILMYLVGFAVIAWARRIPATR